MHSIRISTCGGQQRRQKSPAVVGWGIRTAPSGFMYAVVPLTALGLIGCEAATAPLAERPEIASSAVTASPGNVLSAIVTAEVRNADSVAVRFGLTGAALDGVTAAVVLLDSDVLVPVLGLLPDATYALRVVAYRNGHSLEGETLSFTTGALPPDLPAFVAGGSNPSPGYVAFAAGSYGLVIDNSGRVVWYHHFPNGAGLNFQAQPTGRYTARPAPASQAADWVEIDPLGNVTRSLGCARGLNTRLHDLLALADGSWWLLCDETRAIDLTSHGGVAAARVLGTVVQHVGDAGALLFEWSPFDHFDITDLEAGERAGSTVNWTHGNALDIDADGNLLVSFRSLSEVTKIDTRTGHVLWRMGGVRNEFSFENVVAPAFARQHGVRVTGPASFLLLDNLGDPRESRVEHYGYDARARTARLLRAYRSTPPVLGLLGGTTQPLPGGRVLVSYGNGGRVEEYDSAGNIVWRLEQPGYVFRAQRIRSLYRPGVGSAR